MKKATRIGFIVLALFIAPILGSGIAHAEYYVKKGDSLSVIAKRNNMTLKDIVSLNPQFKNPNVIHIGDYVVLRSKNKALDIVDYAKSLQDVTTYVYGGQQAPTKTDCSGWVQHIYKKFGITLPRVSRDQAKVGTPVAFKELKMGDLMYFSTNKDKSITHVGIYMGDNYWISNLNETKDVEILSNWGSWTQSYFQYAKRVL